MAKQVGLFLAMLKAEIEDRIQDVRAFSTLLDQRFERSEITAYVHKANQVFLNREDTGLHRLLDFIGHLKEDSYESADAVAEDIKARIRGVREYDESDVISQLVDRKVQKILSYIHTA